jgi:hypothetical protein
MLIVLGVSWSSEVCFSILRHYLARRTLHYSGESGGRYGYLDLRRIAAAAAVYFAGDIKDSHLPKAVSACWGGPAQAESPSTDCCSTLRGPAQPAERVLPVANIALLLQLAHDMAAGLAYLHPSVVHRDLKPQVGCIRDAAYCSCYMHASTCGFAGANLYN